MITKKENEMSKSKPRPRSERLSALRAGFLTGFAAPILVFCYQPSLPQARQGEALQNAWSNIGGVMRNVARRGPGA